MAPHHPWDKIVNSTTWLKEPARAARPDFPALFSIFALDVLNECIPQAQWPRQDFLRVLGQAEPDNPAETRLHSASSPDIKFFEFETTRTPHVHLPGLNNLFPCPSSKLTYPESHACSRVKVPAHFFSFYF